MREQRPHINPSPLSAGTILQAAKSTILVNVARTTFSRIVNFSLCNLAPSIQREGLI